MPPKKKDLSASSSGSSAPSPRTRPSINPDGVEDQCEITLNSEPTIYRELSNFYECIMSRCSQGSTPIQGIRVCCHNTREPCLVAILKTSSSVAPVTKVLIEKKTLYGWAITIGGKWWRVKKNQFKILNSEKLRFSASYLDMRGTVTRLGLGVLLSALTSLNKGWTDKDIESAYMVIMYHISEVCRFTLFRNMILNPLHQHNYTSSEPFLLEHAQYVVNWKKISAAVRKYNVSSRTYAASGDKKDEPKWELSDNIQNRTELRTADQAITVISMLAASD